MTKKETQYLAKSTAASELNLQAYPQIDSNVWISDTPYGQVKITLTAVNKPINVDDAQADWGVRRDAREEKKKEKGE